MLRTSRWRSFRVWVARTRQQRWTSIRNRSSRMMIVNLRCRNRSLLPAIQRCRVKHGPDLAPLSQGAPPRSLGAALRHEGIIARQRYRKGGQSKIRSSGLFQRSCKKIIFVMHWFHWLHTKEERAGDGARPFEIQLSTRRKSVMPREGRRLLLSTSYLASLHYHQAGAKGGAKRRFSI